jgi:GNAT superfamily N-acetyltransferase
VPEIEIRPASAADLERLTAIDPHYTSDYVWQMEVVREENQVNTSFRQVRLPRSVRVEYPRSSGRLVQTWKHRSEILVAVMAEKPVGYASLDLNLAPGTAWIADLVVDRPVRRKAIGTGLVLASSEWALTRDCYQVVLEMQPKNYPAIQMAAKLGCEFCGFNDLHYGSNGIGIFFRKPI